MRYFYLRTIGTVDPIIVKNLISALGLLLPYSFKLVNKNGYPLFAFEPRRNQYYAKRIIQKLVGEIPPDCEKMLGVTDVDLCTPVLTFVYGEAQLDGAVALVSLNRLRQEFYNLPPDNKILLERLLKECIHEVGHCYGLYHCHDSKCVMSFSSSILSIDNKKSGFCLRCKEFLDIKMGKENNG